MGLSTLFKKAILRRWYAKAIAEGGLFFDALNALLLVQVDANFTGKHLIATMGNGHSVQFEIVEGMTPVSMVELCEEFIELYEASAGHLTSPTEAQIFTEMLWQLAPADEVHSDFSMLRTGVAA